jgi:aminoglycoside phosphotransferase (APT) family kinase protein
VTYCLNVTGKPALGRKNKRVNMQISNLQLLKQLHKSTDQLLSELEDPQHKALLGAMNVVLNELLLRDDNAFYIDFYRRGYLLLADGLGSLGEAGKGLRDSFEQLPEALDPRFSMDAIDAEASKLFSALEKVVNLIGYTVDPVLLSLVKRITAWELSLFAHRLKPVPVSRGDAADQPIEINRSALLGYLRAKKPEWRDLEITQFHQVAGGFSKTTILIDTIDALNGKQSFAIRAQQALSMMDLEGSNLANEFPLVQTAFDSGIPVAEPLWLEADRSLLGTSFIVSRRAPGANFGTVKGAQGRLPPETVESLASVMAAIHNIPMARSDAWVNQSHFGKWLDYGSCKGNTIGRIEEWLRQGEGANVLPSPVLTRAWSWLMANVPDCDDPPVFLHGDFGPHNVLLEDGRVSAALDWEVSTPGDPAYDVCGFLNSTIGALDPDHFLAAYRAAGGKEISEYRLRYFEVLLCAIVPLNCHAALKLIQDNDAANINLAVFALQFMHAYPSRLEAAIARAEATRNAATGAAA